MSTIQIARFYKRNAANNYAQQPPRWNCDCCGANLAAWAITDDSGRVWGKTCYLKAIGKSVKAPNWTAMEKAAAMAAKCWPVGATVSHRDGREWTVLEGARVDVINGRPIALVSVRRASGKVVDASPLNLTGQEIFSVTDADGLPIYGDRFNELQASRAADWVMEQLPCTLASVVEWLGEAQWWLSRDELRQILDRQGVEISGGSWVRA
jgi:hypothetical protein